MKRTPLPLLKDISYPALIVIGLFLGLAPFQPQPHLVEKWLLLKAGELSRGLDVFDLFFHALPLLLLLLKLFTEGFSHNGRET